MDSGLGFEKLFKTFSQVDASTTRKFGGTGLGLAISKRLLELMHGSIEVESEVGKGTCFHLSARLQRQAQDSPLRHSKELDLSHSRILLVDDQADNLAILRYYLEAWQAQVICATSAPEALTVLKQYYQRGESIDAAIVDLQMPGMDGEALAQVIKPMSTSLQRR